MVTLNSVLIVAGSGRMLTQTARRAGYIPFVIDLYGDSDTQRLARWYRRARSLDWPDLQPIVTELLSNHPVTHALYGSGFENYPNSLAYLNNQFTLWGNPPDIFSKILDKKNFFSNLTQLAIPYPTISFNKPNDSSIKWLTKPLQGHGGNGIKYYDNQAISSTIYWQHYLEGSSYSALFLANGTEASIVGFNNQWTIQSNHGDFIFSGISNHAVLANEQQRLINSWLQKLVPAFGLYGLNSLDFIGTTQNCYVLEINARPPASMQLYDLNLFQAHIDACQGRLANQPDNLNHEVTGYQIIYASSDLTIPTDFQWPSWCMDLPPDGALINTEQPICSMIAHEKQPQLIKPQLTIKQQMVMAQLNKGINSHGI